MENTDPHAKFGVPMTSGLQVYDFIMSSSSLLTGSLFSLASWYRCLHIAELYQLLSEITEERSNRKLPKEHR